MSMPLIAIVGKPNVGKSTLFNRLIGEKKSIVENKPGVTRDRIYGHCKWRNKTVSLIDTGGLELNSKDVMLKQIKWQIDLAIEQANLIIFVVDLKTGLTATDSQIANILHKTNKPVVVAVNKCDSLGLPTTKFYEFYNLGLGESFEISSTHGYGTGDLLDAVFEKINIDETEKYDEEYLKVAIVGKPNVGKSSLVNKISNQKRAIVSDIAGTTRDATDTVVKNEYGEFIFIDTAGIRRKSKVEENIEYYSVVRAFRAIDSADVCLIMLDATTGFTEQDSKIAGYAHDKGKANIIVVNKWDKMEKETNTLENYKKDLQIKFSFMSYVPFNFISAKTGQRVEKLFYDIRYVYEQNCKKLTTGTLNVMLAEVIAKVQPPSDKGKHLKVFYITQIGIKPPTFVVFVNKLNLFHFSYKRYLENQLRATFNLNATPISIEGRERGRSKK